MALNPLQQKMNETGQTPVSRGMNAHEATDAIAALLDDEGRSPGHKDEGEDRGDIGDNAQGLNDQPELQDDDLNTGMGQGDDDGDTDAPAEVGEDEAKDDGEDGSDDKAANEDEDSEAITTLEGLAEALEMSVEDVLNTLTHTTKAAGTDQTVTLADLVAGYQLKADYDRDKTAIAEQRRNFEAEQQARVSSFQQNSNVLANQFQLVENTLLSRLQDPRLAQLQQDDPAQYVLQQREIENQVHALRAARQQAAQQYEQFMADERKAFMQREGQVLKQDIDDWGDDKLRASLDTIKTLGFSDDELVNVVDSRLIKGALELASLRTENAALRTRIETGEKAAGTIKTTVPKGIKPGKQAAKRGRGPDKSAVSKLRRRLGQTNSVQDAANVIEALME